VDESCIDVSDDLWVVMVIIWRSRKDKPIGVIRSTYYFVSFFTCRTWNEINDIPRQFLNKKNIEIFLEYYQ